MAGFKRERRPGVWELVVYQGRDPVTEKKRWKSETFKGGERAAEKRLAALATELDKEKPSTNQTIGWLMGEYMRLLETENKLSPTTLRTYRNYIKTWILPHVGPFRIKDFTAGDLREFEAKITAEGRSQSTVHQVRQILRGALRFAVDHEWHDRNVAAIARAIHQERSSVLAPTPDEVDALYAAAGTEGSDVATAVALGALLGRRLGELCALRWSDVDLRRGTVRIAASAYTVRGATALKDTKTHAVTVIALGDVELDRLNARRTWQKAHAERVGVELVADPFILSRMSDGSGPPRPDGYSSSFALVRERVGMPQYHFHSLRHYAATRLRSAGVDPMTIARRLGHADPAMLGKVYDHAVEGEDRAIRNVLGGTLALQRPINSL